MKRKLIYPALILIGAAINPITTAAQSYWGFYTEHNYYTVTPRFGLGSTSNPPTVVCEGTQCYDVPQNAFQTTYSVSPGTYQQSVNPGTFRGSPDQGTFRAP